MHDDLLDELRAAKPREDDGFVENHLQTAGGHPTECQCRQCEIFELLEPIVGNTSRGAVEPSGPHTCHWCKERFSHGGDALVHENSCSENPSNAVKTTACPACTGGVARPARWLNTPAMRTCENHGLSCMHCGVARLRDGSTPPPCEHAERVRSEMAKLHMPATRQT